eukprot:gene25547-biopygen10519
MSGVGAPATRPRTWPNSATPTPGGDEHPHHMSGVGAPATRPRNCSPGAYTLGLARNVSGVGAPATTAPPCSAGALTAPLCP